MILLELLSQGTSVLQKAPIVGKFLHGRRICVIFFRNVDAAPVLRYAIVAGRKHEARLLTRRRHRYGHVYEVGGSGVGQLDLGQKRVRASCPLQRQSVLWIFRIFLVSYFYSGLKRSLFLPLTLFVIWTL